MWNVILLAIVAALAVPTHVSADSRGQIVCGVPADEAIAITAQNNRTGKWWAAGPVQRLMLMDEDTEMLALTYVASSITRARGPSGSYDEVTLRDGHQMPTRVCPVQIDGDHPPYTMWRLHYKQASYDYDQRRLIP